MKKLRENGKSYSEIATALNKKGISTRFTKEGKKSSWYSTTVRNILNRRDIILDDEKKIIESIDQNVPVLAFGVIGPPECCIITGNDESGEVIIGWNYFQNEHDDFEPTGQFRKGNWYKDSGFGFNRNIFYAIL